MVNQLVLGISAILWGGLWGYSTLLVALVFMEETESLYAYPMRAALDRFVDTLGFSWLKPLHGMQLSRLRFISYGMFGLITLGLGLMAVVLE